LGKPAGDQPAGFLLPDHTAAQAREPTMNERIETLNKARDRMVEERDAHAKVLAAPFDRDTAARARNKFIETQSLIDAIERAISGENANP
jgi:hypothetical protein